jgi:hypothetical protein
MDMIKVFLSYRRDDSRDQAGRLYDHLVEQFGVEFVFKDVNSIPLGADFREVLTERVAGCDVFLALIGDGWLSVAGPSGTRRLDDPGDFVRIEVEAALGRRIPVIPVLVGNSSVPKAEQLPESLRGLAFRNASLVRPNPDFQHDAERLIRGIKAAVSGSPQPRSRRVGPVALAAVTAVLGVLLLGIIVHVATNTGPNEIEVDDMNDAASKELVRPDVTAGGTGGFPTGPARSPVGETPDAPTSAPSLEKAPALSPVIGAINTKGAFQPLFNGEDLKGWEFGQGDARTWRLENQTLVAVDAAGRGQDATGPGRLLTERSFREFIFRFEYQSLSSDIGFGAVWWALPGEMPPSFHPPASTLGLGTNRRGQFVFRKVIASELKEGEGWNTVEIEARDRLIRISVNGRETVRRVLGEKPAEPTALKTTKPDGPFPRIGMDRRNGRVGFHFNRGTGRFRKIEIKEL